MKCVFLVRRIGVKSKQNANPDLHTQYESLLDQVWRSEADWRLWDRVDALVMLETLRAKRAGGAREKVQADGAPPDTSSENAA
jgi:hypothetical protein